MLRFAAAGDGDNSSEDESFVFGDETDAQEDASLEGSTALLVPNLMNNYALSTVAKSQKSCIVKVVKDNLLLLTDLQNAVISGNVEVVSCMLSEQPDLCNLLLGSGWTALMYAANFGNLELVKIIIKFGGDVNVKSSNGCTALIAACKSSASSSNVFPVVQHLLDASADVSVQDDSGKTALIYAARNESIDILKLLFQQPNIDTNVKDKRNWTALDWAVSKNSEEVVHCLICNGANIATATAHEQMSPGIKSILLEYGVTVYDFGSSCKLPSDHSHVNKEQSDFLHTLKVVCNSSTQVPNSHSDGDEVAIVFAKNDLDCAYQRYNHLSLESLVIFYRCIC